MSAYLLTIHLFNLLAPAAALALLLALLAPGLPLWRGTRPWVASWPARFFWGLLVNLGVLVGSFWVGAPGKMETYAALLIASVLAQFVMLRGWQSGR